MTGLEPKPAPRGETDARQALRFMLAKATLFALVPVAVAAVIVFLTLPP